MKNVITIIILAVFLTGCAWQTTVELGIGKQIDTAKVIYTDGIVCSLAVRHASKEGYFVEYRHVSGCTSGPPFNDQPETWTDTVYTGKVWIIRKGENR
jgi:hypothetical protein